MKIDVFKNTVKSSVWGVVSKIFTLLGAFIVRTIIIYKLGVEYVGLDGLFASILNILNLSELGIGSAIVFNMYSCIVDEDNETINQLLYLYKKTYSIIAAIIFLVGIVISIFLRTLIHSDVPNGINIYILYFLFLLNTSMGYLFAMYRTSVFSAYQRNDIKAKIQIVSDVIMYSFQIIAIVAFKNYYYYIAAMLLSIVPRNLLYYYSFKNNFPLLHPTSMPDKTITDDIVSRVLPLIGHKVGGAFLVSLDSIIISAFLGLKILGKYNNYYYVMTAIIGFTTIIQQALVAGIGNKIIVLNDGELSKLYEKCSFVWIWIIGLFSIEYACLIQNFVNVWLGEKFLLPTYIAITIAVYFFLWQFRLICMTFKDAGGLWKNDWFKPYIGMILNALSSSLLVYFTKNVVFVLIPTCFIFLFIYFPIEISVISKEIFHNNPKIVIVPNVIQIIVVSISGLFVYCINSLIGGGSFVYLLIRAILVFVLFNLIMFLCYRKTNVFKDSLSYIKKNKKVEE